MDKNAQSETHSYHALLGSGDVYPWASPDFIQNHLSEPMIEAYSRQIGFVREQKNLAAASVLGPRIAAEVLLALEKSRLKA